MLRTGVLLNAQSCNPSAQSRCAWKLPYLRETIEAIPGIVPFVAVTETWLKPYIEDSQISHGPVRKSCEFTNLVRCKFNLKEIQIAFLRLSRGHMGPSTWWTVLSNQGGSHEW